MAQLNIFNCVFAVWIWGYFLLLLYFLLIIFTFIYQRKYTTKTCLVEFERLLNFHAFSEDSVDQINLNQKKINQTSIYQGNPNQKSSQRKNQQPKTNSYFACNLTFYVFCWFNRSIQSCIFSTTFLLWVSALK